MFTAMAPIRTYGTRSRHTTLSNLSWTEETRPKPPKISQISHSLLAPTVPTMKTTPKQDESIDLEDEQKVQEYQATPKLSLEIPASGGFKEYHPISYDAPRCLLALPYHIRKVIWKELLQRPSQIMPFYNCGSAVVPDYMTLKADLDISLLLVNKQIHAEAVEALYGMNGFKFMKPQVAIWWFQRIGRSNLENITSAYFILDADEDVNFHVREERLWRALFTYLQPRQRFQNVGISFERWSEDGFNYLTPFDQDRIWGSRDKSVAKLAEFRGVRTVQIRGGNFLNARDEGHLIACMMLPHGVTSTPQQAIEIEIEAEMIARRQSPRVVDQDDETSGGVMLRYDNRKEGMDEHSNGYYFDDNTGCYYDENGCFYEDDAYDYGYQPEEEYDERDHHQQWRIYDLEQAVNQT